MSKIEATKTTNEIISHKSQVFK